MIILDHVSKIYQMDGVEVKAVQDLTLHIKKGESVAIMGPSGSGKSTLMHLIGALDVPTSGTVTINGDNISKLDEIQLAHLRNKTIGFVFQQFNLLARTSALDNVMLPLFYSQTTRSERKHIAEEMLIKVGLKERMHHMPNQLSGGQQQRVAIARAMVNQPEIILADEPTGNLDSKAGKEIMEIFTSLDKEGKTVVIITHEKEIARYADKIIRIRDGFLVKR